MILIIQMKVITMCREYRNKLLDNKLIEEPALFMKCEIYAQLVAPNATAKNINKKTLII